MVRRARARLLLALCTFALGIGLGLALILPVALREPATVFTLPVPGDTTAALEPARYTFAVSGSDLPLEDTRPICTALLLPPDGERVPVPVLSKEGSGFAAMRVTRAGEHQIACSSSVDGLTVTVRTSREDDAARVLRAVLLVLVLTALAAIMAARPLLLLRRPDQP